MKRAVAPEHQWKCPQIIYTTRPPALYRIPRIRSHCESKFLSNTLTLHWSNLLILHLWNLFNIFVKLHSCMQVLCLVYLQRDRNPISVLFSYGQTNNFGIFTELKLLSVSLSSKPQCGPYYIESGQNIHVFSRLGSTFTFIMHSIGPKSRYNPMKFFCQL